ncbi:MAG: hypothetical protein EA349_12950 [Halomonadaceae bacterium]|nr:MAG: hypothetical protein EA349_12950 [Halomonadaceae bacterium]
MVDGVNPQTGNLLREVSGANRQGQENQTQQSANSDDRRAEASGAARPVSDISVDISAQGFQQSSAEQLTNQAVTDPSATPSNGASTFAEADFGDASRAANDDARGDGVESAPFNDGAVPGASSPDADQLMGTNVDTRA